MGSQREWLQRGLTLRLRVYHLTVAQILISLEPRGVVWNLNDVWS